MVISLLDPDLVAGLGRIEGFVNILKGFSPGDAVAGNNHVSIDIPDLPVFTGSAIDNVDYPGLAEKIKRCSFGRITIFIEVGEIGRQERVIAGVNGG